MKGLLLLFSILALSFGSLNCFFTTFTVKKPDQFVRYNGEIRGYKYKAVSSDLAVIAVKAQPNVDSAPLSYWTDSILKNLIYVEGYNPYNASDDVIFEQVNEDFNSIWVDFKSTQNRDSKYVLLQNNYYGEVYAYFLAVFATGKKIFTVEFGCQKSSGPYMKRE